MKTFKQIASHPRYEINEFGIVRNIKTKSIKSQYLNDSGYYMISCSYGNKSKPARVHRLLAETFIENPLNLKCINHKNGIKTDNSIENLEWCTHLENMRHAFSTGLVNNTGEKNGQAKLKEQDVIKIKTLLLSGKSQQKIANEFNVSRSAVLGIHIGRLWKHVLLRRDEQTP